MVEDSRAGRIERHAALFLILQEAAHPSHGPREVVEGTTVGTGIAAGFRVDTAPRLLDELPALASAAPTKYGA
jgi:hypothetical protein